MNVALLQKELNTNPGDCKFTVRATLAAAPPEKAIATLLEIAEREEQKRRVLNAARWTFDGIWITATLAWLSLFSFFYKTWWNLGTPLQIAVPQLVRYFTSNDTRLKRLQNAVIALLAYPDEPRFLLPFIDALHLTQTPELKSLLYPRLTEKLWSLPASEAAIWLDAARRAALRSVIAEPYSIMPNGKRGVRHAGHFDDETTDLAVAAIKTLAGLGDAKTAKILRRILRAETKTANETVVRDAAREYLPILERHQERCEAVRWQLWKEAIEETENSYQAIEKFVDTLPPEEIKVALTEYLSGACPTVIDVFVRLIVIVFGGLLFSMGIGALFYAVVSVVAKRHIEGAGAIFVIAITGMGGLLLFYATKPVFNSDVRKVAYELAKRSGTDIRLLAPLLRIAPSPLNNKQSDAIKKALVRLLPLVRPGDAALIPPAKRACLRSWLKIPRGKKGAVQHDLTCAVLHALAVVGDTKTLKRAEKIARRAAADTKSEIALHDAAVRCVETLRARRGGPPAPQ